MSKKWRNESIVVCGTDCWQKIRYAVKNGILQPLVLYSNHRVYLSEFTFDIEKCQMFSDLVQRKIIGTTNNYKINYLVHFSDDGKRAKTFKWEYLSDIYPPK